MQNLNLVRSNSSTSLSKAEAVEKYYERNAHTVSGIHKNQDTFGQLQRRYKPKQDGVSVLSSPGALGDTVIPTKRHFDRSMYWFAFHRKQIGLRHILVAFMVLSYTIFGAFMFWTVESRYERAVSLSIGDGYCERCVEQARETTFVVFSKICKVLRCEGLKRSMKS